ncbi:uncharacterized protein [Dysidea avara]|uniref:uncharacterized protein isoform X2 n=1 Tax=Dysidea avara TaxID=196820 RepID=UPI0033259076
MSETNSCQIVSAKFPINWSISRAYGKLTSNVGILLESKRFEQLRRACVQEVNSLGSTLPKSLVPKIQQTKSLNDMLDVLAQSPYWNWFDIRLLQALVTASGSAEAEEWLESFKATYYSKNIFDLIPYVNVKPLNEFIKLVEKFDKNPRDLTVSELLQHKYKLEYEVLDIDEGELVLSCIKTGCVELTWLMPRELAYQAYTSMKKHSELSSITIKSLVCEAADECRGLPYLWHGQEVKEVGPIEPLPEHIRQEPYSLQKGFQWVPLTKSDVLEVASFQSMDDSIVCDASFKFLFTHPNRRSDWHFAIRTTKGALVGVVLASPVSINIGGVLVHCVSPFLLSHDKYMNKRLWYILNKELQRRVNLYKINQFVYNGLFKSLNVVKPVVTFTNWCYQFASPNSYSLPDSPRTPGWRKINPEDVPRASAFVNKYSSQFEIGIIFNDEDFSHYYLCSAIPNYVFTFIVENDDSITDLVRYELYIEAAEVALATVTTVVSTLSPVEQLIIDVLASARNNGAVELSIIQHNIKRDILLSLGFLPDLLPPIPVYMYNYQYSEISETKCFYPI